MCNICSLADDWERWQQSQLGQSTHIWDWDSWCRVRGRLWSRTFQTQPCRQFLTVSGVSRVVVFQIFSPSASSQKSHLMGWVGLLLLSESEREIMMRG